MQKPGLRLCIVMAATSLFGDELALRKTLLHPSGAVVQLAFGPDGKMLVSAGALDNIIRLWDVESGEHVAIQASHGTGIRRGIFDVALSPDGKTVASSGLDQRIVLWDVATAKELKTLAFEEMTFAETLSFSPDGKLLASGNRVKKDFLTLWDVASGKVTAILGSYETPVQSVVFSPDGKMLASASGGEIKLWKVADGKCAATFKEATYVKALGFSSDGKILACSGVEGVRGDLDHVLRFRDVKSGRVTATLRGHTGGIDCLAFSPDGKWLASGGAEANLILWDVASGEARVQLKLWEKAGDFVKSVAFSPDGKMLASATSPGGKGVIKMWEVPQE